MSKEINRQAESTIGARNRLASIFTDVQFWVPVIVLAAGLLLLEWIR